ncbi:MAG: DUF3592 domain-containing protein [Bacteroidota bacterium]
MGETRRSPSLTRIISTDYPAMLAVLFPVVAWGIYAALRIFGRLPDRHGRMVSSAEAGPFFFYVGLAALVIGVPLLVMRVRTLRGAFSRGIETEGLITNLYFHRDRGRVEYTYEYQGRTYKRRNAINRNNRTRKLVMGTKTVVVVDPDKPERAFIKALYL